MGIRIISSICVYLMTVLPSASLHGQGDNCSYVFNGIDLQTKQYLIEVAPESFFNYTPPEIKNDLQEENLIQCRGQIVKADDQASLHLNIQINSLKAQEYYGTIDAGYILKVIFLDEQELSLKCAAGSKGVMPRNQKNYIYPVGYKLSSREIRMLSKKEIDKIGIQWSSGYEEYPIYEIDFLMNQVLCLNQAEQQKPN